MWKTTIIFIFSLLAFQGAKAQKDTLLYYMKNDYQLVAQKDSAKYFLFIMPADTVDGKYAYPIKEFYPNGKTKLIGYSTSQRYSQLIMEGSCIEFYNNGFRKSITNYKNGYLTGDITLYYPNRKLYAIETLNSKMETKLIECRDTSGNVLAENGNGEWLKYRDDYYKTKLEEGPVKDSVEDGEWHEIVNDSAKFVTVFKKGVVISSTNPHRRLGVETDLIFAAVEKEPEYKGGIRAFYTALQKVLIYPAIDRENNVQGKVMLTFVVERDGTLTGLHAISTPSATLEAACIDALKQMPPWIPGMQGGRPVRVQFTLPISFNLGNQ